MGSGKGAAPHVSDRGTTVTTSAPVRALRILLADDHDENRQLVKAFLAGTPHEVHVAENGQVAFEMFQDKAWDLVFMDMQMPVMDGYTATASIRQWEQEHGRPRTPVLALTAYALREEEQKSLAAGCDAHLTKPIKKATLLEALTRFTSEHGGDREAAVALETVAPEAAAPEIASPRAGDREAVTVGVELKELVQTYLENRKSDAEQIPVLVDRGDFDTVQVLGHRMKGVAPAYGFDPLGAIGARLETAAANRDRAEALACVDDMRNYLRRVEVQFMDKTA
jgi:CheY-like chemotaxis protein/HPt (histidine-containing phosphotransfer) domain-containing protein